MKYTLLLTLILSASCGQSTYTQSIQVLDECLESQIEVNNDKTQSMVEFDSIEVPMEGKIPACNTISD